jgi:uncharacterized protein YraI
MHIKGMVFLTALMAAAAPMPTYAAATMASAITPLNIRSGPGPEYAVIGAINRHGRAVVESCTTGSLWCQVDYHGRQGWAYSKYLTTHAAGRPLVIATNRTQIRIPTVAYAAPIETVGSNAQTENVIGTLIEPPTNATTVELNPPETIRTYVISHPMESTILNGEIVTGAGVPEKVTLTPVPGYGYDYAYINREPVLVAPSTRRIIYIYR